MTNPTDVLVSTFLVSSLWRASWQGALAFLFVGVLCRALARRLSADAHCWLWRLSYAKLLVGLVWSGAVLVPLLSPIPLPPPSAQSSVAFNPAQEGPGRKAAVINAGMTAAADTPAIRAGAKPGSTWRIYLAIAYGLGVAVCLGRLLLEVGRTGRVLRSAVPSASGPEAACAAVLAWRMGLRQPPRLARSAAVNSPVFVAGRVLLPAEVHYDEADLRMILAHELGHARRQDLAWEWLGTLVQVVFFFHPLVVLARREERLAREASADALALQVTGVPSADYGRLLLSLSLGPNRRHPALAGSVGVIEGGTLLRRRLLALRDGVARAGPPRNRWRVAAILVPLTALVLVPWQMTHGQTPPLSRPRPPYTAAPIILGQPRMPAGNKRIIGVVRDEQGKPVAGIDVGFSWHWSRRQKPGEESTGTSLVGYVLTDAQGRFTFPGLPTGKFDYEVWSQAERYVPVRAPLVLAASDSKKAVRVVVSTGSLVTGRVVDRQTGNPLPGIYVDAGPIPPRGGLVKWASWEITSAGQTDAEGRYQVRVSPGNVFVGVGRTISNTVLSRRVRYAVQKVSVGFGQTAAAPDLSVLLHPVLVCEGPDGRPVAGATISIVPDDMTKDGWAVGEQTDEAGAVVLGHIENGSFSITQDGRLASGTFHYSPGQPLLVTTDGQTQSYPLGIGTIHLTEEAACIVTGTVVSEGGKALPDALVRVMGTNPKNRSVGDQHDFRTDASGVFHMALDPGGEYRVSVRADGFNQVAVDEKPLALVKGTTLNLGVVHLLPAAGSVSGRVLDAAGKPLPGVLAFVRGGKTFLSAAVTDDGGRFRIPNVVVGEALTLELCLQGEARDSSTALSQSNETMDLPGVRASPAERKIVWHPHR